MSMEIHVLSNTKLPAIEAWQQAIDTEAFNLKLDPDVKLEMASGFVPALLHDTESGFECFHDDVAELMETYAETALADSGEHWKHALSLRWGSQSHEGVSVFMAAAAYARATQGVVFEPEEGRILTVDECGDIARTWEKEEFKA
ncbi:MAG TPA: hypothetical protein VJR71_00770 [Pseudolabrys sp.]|nr:hypothetical protein [Pseudolabrys sp.]